MFQIVRHFKANHLLWAFRQALEMYYGVFVLIDCVLNKLCVEKISLVAHDPLPDNPVSKRSLEMLSRFSFVDEIFTYPYNIHTVPTVDKSTGCYNYITPGFYSHSAEFPFCYSLTLNGMLERGMTFIEIAEELNLDSTLINYDIFRHYYEKPADAIYVECIRAISPAGYVVFYPGPLGGNTIAGFNRGGAWSPDDWVSLGAILHDKWGTKIVLTGASYDLSYLREVLQAASRRNLLEIFINLCGCCTLPETLSLLKHASCVVGFPSGIPISATYLKTKTVMFWRPQESSIFPDIHVGFSRNFAINWVPPHLCCQTYIPAWYGEDTVFSIVDKIEKFGWKSADGKTPFCNDMTSICCGSYIPTPEAQIVKYIYETLMDNVSNIPTYIDIGANHPLTSNNSYFFYQNGSKGILIEPNKYFVDLCKRMRPNDIVLDVCCGYDDSDKVLYYEFDIHDGCNTISKEWVSYAELYGINVKKKYYVNSLKLSYIFDKYFNGLSPDLIFIDAEGVDSLILKSIDYKKYRPKVITIESNKEAFIDGATNQIVNFMRDNNYIYIAHTAANMIFCDKKFFTVKRLIWSTAN